MSLLEARGVVLTDRFQILWRAFEICKDTYFLKYMGRDQVTHAKDKIPVLSLIADKILKFALDKYTDRSRNNNVWVSLSKRETESVVIAYEVTTMEGNLKLAYKILKSRNSVEAEEAKRQRPGNQTSTSPRRKRQHASPYGRASELH